MSKVAGFFSFFDDLFFLAYPEFCLITGKLLSGNEFLISQEGFAQMPLAATNPDKQLSEIKQRLVGRLKVEKAWAYLVFRRYSPSRRLMHEFKYRGNTELGALLTRRHVLLIKSQLLDSIDVIVPVPMHPLKEKMRGFNQSNIIASAIGEITGLPVYSQALMKNLNTGSLTRLSRWNRFAASQTIYQANEEYRDQIRNKRILLVDDVMTTGATFEICGNALFDLEACAVSIYTLMISEK